MTSSKILGLLFLLFITSILATIYGVYSNIKSNDQLMIAKRNLEIVRDSLDIERKIFLKKAKQTDSLNRLVNNLIAENQMLKSGQNLKASTIKIPGELPKPEVLEKETIVGLYCLNPNAEKLKTIKGYLSEEEFLLDSEYEYNKRPNWMAYENTVFYYRNISKNEAQKMADELSSRTNTNYVIKRGNGLGVLPGQEDRTFFIHYVSE